MASILNTDISELYNTWGERVAFNEGFQAQKIAEAKAAGREAFHLGVDSAQGKDIYFAAKDQRFAEAREFLSSEPQQINDSRTDDISDVEPEPVDIDPVGDVTDGEETLGMESVVANETELLDDGVSWYEEVMQDHFETEQLKYDWDIAHDMNDAVDSGMFGFFDGQFVRI